MHEEIASVLLTPEQINARVQALAAQISADYQGRHLTVVGVLKGSLIFTADLIRHLTVRCSVEFMSVASYQGQVRTGNVRVLLDLRENPAGKDILLVEDIADSGTTLAYLHEMIMPRHPASLRTCALLDKPSARKVPVSLAYVGFQIPDAFVVGYGLDYNEAYRNLPYIGVLKQPEEI